MADTLIPQLLQRVSLPSEPKVEPFVKIDVRLHYRELRIKVMREL